MHDMTEDRARIFAQLNRIVRPWGAKRDVDPDEYIDATDGLEEFDPLDFYLGVRRDFGLQYTTDEVLRCGGEGAELPKAEWMHRYARCWTWNGLVDFLLARLQSVRVEEAVVLGRRCGPAGAFFALREVAAELDIPAEFRPSDRITRRIPRESRRAFWNRARWLSRDQVDHLEPSWMAIFAFGSLFVLAILLLGASCTAPPLFVLAVACAVAAKLMHPLTQRVPERFRTFRDLSIAVWHGADGDVSS